MKICIIDDHLLFAQSLRSVLDPLGKLHEIRLYKTGEAFIADDFTQWRPDIVLTDLLLPGISGLELLEKTRRRKFKFNVRTAVSDAATVKEALKKGVHGYLTKDISEEELKEALAECAEGKRYINRALKDKIVEDIFADNQPDFHLSPREKELLELICSGLTPKEISAKLSLSIYTVHQYNKNLMRKLKVNRTTDMVLLAIRQGLFVPPTAK